MSKLIASNFKTSPGYCGHLFPPVITEPKPTTSHLFQHTASTANKLRKTESTTLTNIPSQRELSRGRNTCQVVASKPSKKFSSPRVKK